MKGTTTLNLPDKDGLRTMVKTIKMINPTDKKNKSSNQYSIDVNENDKKFTAYFRTENFKQIVDDYDIDGYQGSRFLIL